MSGSSASEQPPPSQHTPLQPRPNGAPGSSKAVTFEDVARLFTLPIADAAASLGVCTSVLKRICRVNGIARWPYRQFLAGKTMEDIQKEAAREKNKHLSELANAAKPAMSPTTIAEANLGSQPHLRSITQTLSLENSKLQKAGSAHAQANKPQTERNNTNALPQSLQSRSIPNFLDEFKYGFPSDDLSHISNRWWGSGTEEGGDTSDRKEENALANEEPSCIDGKSSNIASQPVSELVSLRRRLVKDGRDSLRLGVSNGYCPYKLSTREKSVLLAVFHTLPGQWK